MLAESFVFLPGIGARTERRLWRRGVRDWGAYRQQAKPPRSTNHAPLLDRAEAALASRRGAFFAQHLPRAEHWRALGEFGHGALAVDIETDDRGITVVGIHGPKPLVDAQGPYDRDLGDSATRFLVRGEDLTPEAVTAALAPASILLSYNGASFDMPVLARYGVDFPDVPHADLRGPLARCGLRGGLKKVEARAGLSRPAEVAGLTGYDAILLWRQHELGDAKALPRLLLYNAFDVENLPPLASLAYGRLRHEALGAPPEATLARFQA